MAAHILADLLGEPLHLLAMEMPGNRGRLVATGAAVVEKSIPEFGIARAPCRAHIQPHVEQSDIVEYLAAECLACARADQPGRRPVWCALAIEVLTEVLTLYSLCQIPNGFRISVARAWKALREGQGR